LGILDLADGPLKLGILELAVGHLEVGRCQGERIALAVSPNADGVHAHSEPPPVTGSLSLAGNEVLVAGNDDASAGGGKRGRRQRDFLGEVCGRTELAYHGVADADA
jgi:hypothetical protein